MARDPSDLHDYKPTDFTVESLRLDCSAEVVAARREHLLREARENASPERQALLREGYGAFVRWVRTTPEGKAWLREAGEEHEREIARFEASMKPDIDDGSPASAESRCDP